MRVLRVLLPLPLGPVSCLPPFPDPGGDLTGWRLVVPWREEYQVGIVLGEEPSRPAPHLRHALGFLGQKPWLRAQELAFLQAAAEEVFAPLGTLLDDLVFLPRRFRHRVRLAPAAPKSLLPPGLESLAAGWQLARSFDSKLLESLREGGILEDAVGESAPSFGWRIGEKALPEPERQALEPFREVEAWPSLTELSRQSGLSLGTLRRLVREGFIEKFSSTPGPALPPSPSEPDEIPEALYGGRLTQRLKLLARWMALGPTLLIFPELALLRRYAQVLSGAAFHGELSEEERRALWEALPERPTHILATYLGLSLPMTPRLIVLVEEDEPSYKLPKGSRAWIPRLAALRARLLGVPLLRLSQLPSLESLSLSGRGLPWPSPRPEVINLQQERTWPLSQEALRLLRQVAERNYQAIVLAPRKGHSSLLRCPRCGWRAMCPRCSLPLRYHKEGRGGFLLCHQCGHLEPAPSWCPVCSSEILELRGLGVGRLFEALSEQNLGLPITLYTREHKGDLSPLLRGDPGILLGTTAILRAPLLPGLALIVLPYADGFLMESDFRASERYIRLLWRLTELHPSRRPLILVQTFEPQHPVHQSFLQGDPLPLLRAELERRKELAYPPAVRMVKLEVAQAHEQRARMLAEQIAAWLRGRGVSGLLGPAAAPIPRLKGRYLFHLLLRGETETLAPLLSGLREAFGGRVQVDPDPINFAGILED